MNEKYDFYKKNGIEITEDNVRIDGCGATMAGGSDDDGACGCYGIGIRIEGRKNVVIENLNVKGFDIGVFIHNCENVTLRNCDFTGCFNDPAWGWDDHGNHGGIYILNSSNCTVTHCKAVHVWDALHLRNSHHNIITHNDFSHCSNTGIKLWHACNNSISDNDFSYGIRIDPGEVHARDSSSVLIESGSNYNIFLRNDMSHGGDGLFIRVLNGFMSTHNIFEENDCSYANNNAIEAWADNNTYIRNKANYSSYGFWLGGSDNTVLIGNEVAFNGGINHNAPEAFGNSGIAIVNGSGSHIVMQDNYIHDNNGPGVAIRFTKDYPSYHWVVQNNRIENNKDCGSYKGYGIYAKNAEFLTFANNTFAGNDGEDVHYDGRVSDVYTLGGDSDIIPKVSIAEIPLPIVAGKAISLKAIGDATSYRWDLGDGTIATDEQLTHIYAQPGFYRLALTGDNGSRAAITFANVYVCASDSFVKYNIDEVTATADAGECAVNMSKDKTVSGNGYLCVNSPCGTETVINIPLESAAMECLCGFFGFTSDADPDWERAIVSPIVRVSQDDDNYIEYTPDVSFAAMLTQNEYKDNWIPFNLSEGFTATTVGNPAMANKLTITVRTISTGITTIRLDALSFVKPQPVAAERICVNKIEKGREYPKATLSDCAILRGDDFINAADGGDISANTVYNLHLGSVPNLYGDATPRAVFADGGEITVEFGADIPINTADIWLYANPSHTLNSMNEQLPAKVEVDCLCGSEWKTVASCTKATVGLNSYTFAEATASAIRIKLTGTNAAVYGIRAYNSGVIAEATYIASNPKPLTLTKILVKLRKEIFTNSYPLSDLIARVYTLNDKGEPDTCVYETIVAEKDVIHEGITSIDIGMENCVPGAKYALAFSQTKLVESRTQDNYYRWVAGHAGHNETFAIYDEEKGASSDYNWGTAWLQADCDGIIADYTNTSEHIGVRFGLFDIPYRYMTFTIPDAAAALHDGIACSAPAYGFNGGTLTVSVKESASALCVWLDKDCTLTINGAPHKCAAGLNKIAASATEYTIATDDDMVKVLELQLVK